MLGTQCTRITIFRAAGRYRDGGGLVPANFCIYLNTGGGGQYYAHHIAGMAHGLKMWGVIRNVGGIIWPPWLR